jgi:hypothetical protein
LRAIANFPAATTASAANNGALEKYEQGLKRKIHLFFESIDSKIEIALAEICSEYSTELGVNFANSFNLAMTSLLGRSLD